MSSPTPNQDKPIKVAWGDKDTNLRVMCFFVANTSQPRTDAPDWPRVTSVGFELPGDLSGFSLLEPLNGDWELEEGQAATIPGRGSVTSIEARVNPIGYGYGGPNDLLGLPPGQPSGRGNGTRFCVAGPLPDWLPDANPPHLPVDTTIENLINGVVIGFHGVQPNGPARDLGLWDSPLRVVPMYE